MNSVESIGGKAGRIKAESPLELLEELMETLIKIDPEKHMHRWYSVGVQSTLVDGIAVIYGWGSLKSSFQHWRTVPVGSLKEAEEIVSKILNTKLEKGYERRETV